MSCAPAGTANGAVREADDRDDAPSSSLVFPRSGRLAHAVQKVAPVVLTHRRTET
jgi:hypothetical protein